MTLDEALERWPVDSKWRQPDGNVMAVVSWFEADKRPAVIWHWAEPPEETTLYEYSWVAWEYLAKERVDG